MAVAPLYTPDQLFKALLKLHDDTVKLVDYSSKWLNDSTQWESDEHLGPMWQDVYNRRYEIESEWNRQ